MKTTKDLLRVPRRTRLGSFVAMVLAVLVPFTPGRLEEGGVVACPDVETSSERYKTRFRTRTGQWFLQRQADTLLAMLKAWPGARILDVGGGHGQYTRLLVENGYQVTVLGSTGDADGQIGDLIANGSCAYRVGNLLSLPFPEKSFDLVISFRLLAHLEDWRGFVSEASRVASRAVVVDLPVLKSTNLLYPAMFWLKRIAEGNSTRPFRIFREREVIDAFAEAGFGRASRTAQYFFPMVLHRALHMQTLSRTVERWCEAVGLTQSFGSPVVLCLEPDAPSQAG